jgi:hypothetical protein
MLGRRGRRRRGAAAADALLRAAAGMTSRPALTDAIDAFCCELQVERGLSR